VLHTPPHREDWIDTHVAVCCSMLHVPRHTPAHHRDSIDAHVAVHYSMLQCVAECYTHLLIVKTGLLLMLQCITVCCSAVRDVVAHTHYIAN